MTNTPPDFDVLIVGAGISGIGMAAHMEMMCPGLSYTVLDQRENLGGTWDLFRYPGVRSDSDMQTLSYHFEPWLHEKAIAGAGHIMDYLNKVVDERGIRDNIRLRSKVVAADWSSKDARWNVTVETGTGNISTITANWLYLGSGYYDYESPHEANIPGIEVFAGETVHPQFWPEDFDYSGKRVIVIGSGATAITLVPSMAQDAAHVTMLQRTPTWILSTSSKDRIGNILHKILPGRWAHKLIRKKNIYFTDMLVKKSLSQPEKVKEYLTKKAKEALGDKYDAAALTPPYNPWEERMCFVPDGDLFEAIRQDKARIVTGHIETVDAGGIYLKDGTYLPADVIVTATGLKIALAGKISVSVDGDAVEWSEKFFYKNCMFSGVPNLSLITVYLNISATLRADLIADYVCRVLNYMRKKGAVAATPSLADPDSLELHDMLDFSSGYIQRAKHLFPKSSTTDPWRLSHDYRHDRAFMRDDPIEDGNLVLSYAGQDDQREAAE